MNEEATSQPPGTPSITLPLEQEDYDSDSPPRRVKSLRDIYETYNFVSLEPESFEVAVKQENWRRAMEEEIKTIEKN